MPQVHFYIPEETVARLREKAKSRKQSLSKFIAEIVAKEVEPKGWPEGYLEQVIGSWQGDLPEIEDLEPEERDSLDVPA